MNTPKFGRVNKTRILMIIMIAVVVILLAVVGVLLFLNGRSKNGKNNGSKTTPAPTNKAAMVTATPVPSETVQATSTPTVAVVPTNTPVPTDTPTPTPGPVVVGLNLVPAIIRDQVQAQAAETIADAKIWGGSSAKNPRIEIETYIYPSYISLLFTCTAEGSDKTHKEAFTYDAESGNKLLAKDVFRETYLAIIKERLQTYAPNKDASFEGTSFVGYDEAYRANDYNSFYIHENKVTFIFPNGTLIELIHDEFTYTTDLAEARAFMYKDVEGVPVGLQVRTDLDPKRPMIAITFDDGPYEPVEKRLLEILDQYDAKCTFFSLGRRIDGTQANYKAMIKKIAEAGHEVASHTYDHTYFSKEDCDKKVFWTNINKNNLILAEAVGYAPTMIRMPGGYDQLTYMSKYLPMPMINWYLDTRDWEGGITYPETKTEEQYNDKVNKIYREVMDNVGDGQIILMHSLYQSSADAADQILSALYGQGYQFVTVSELFYYKGITLENGKVSFSTTTKRNYNRDYAKK